jgi:hypothetical protein
LSTLDDPLLARNFRIQIEESLSGIDGILTKYACPASPSVCSVCSTRYYPMADIKTLLGQLGMSEYTIMDITEADLTYLAVSLTHQKRLQQEISKARTQSKR